MSITPAWQRGHTHPHTVPVIGTCCLGPLLATKGMSDIHCKLHSLSYKCAKYTGDGTCTFTYFKNIYCQNFKMWLTYTLRYSAVLCNMKPDWKKCFKSDFRNLFIKCIPPFTTKGNIGELSWNIESVAHSRKHCSHILSIRFTLFGFGESTDWAEQAWGRTQVVHTLTEFTGVLAVPFTHLCTLVH